MRMTNRDAGRVLSDFEGVWRVSRQITPDAGPAARFEGTASWVPSEGGLAYNEQGLMTLEGHPPMQAERRYFWDSALSVYFEDGRFFHQVPSQGGPTEHWCDPDRYQLRYDFSRWPSFGVTWRVHGPRKDYRAETEYTRC